MEDLALNIEVILSQWKRGVYPIYAAFNGHTAGIRLPETALTHAKIIQVDDNPGHKGGALRLLLEGLTALPTECEFAVTLEADSWLLDDAIISKYLGIMKSESGIVWAAGNWVDKHHSLAVDFALVRLSFIREFHHLIAFTDHIESRLYTLIQSLGFKSLIIKEVNPTHIPKAMPLVLQASGRRRRAFPRGPMVTHHIEDLPGGMAEKRRIANRTAGKVIFAGEFSESALTIALCHYGYLAYEKLLALVPKSRWMRGRKLVEVA